MQLAPISATIIQLAISRSREFGADSSGARITADPLALARLRAGFQAVPFPALAESGYRAW